MNNTGSPPDTLPTRSRWGMLLLLSYPFVLFFLLMSQQPLLEFAGIASLAVVILLPLLVGGRWFAWPLLLATLAAAAYGAFGGHGAIVSYLPQILVAGLLALFFGRSLRPGSVPLITRIAVAIHDGDPTGVPTTYTRGVTILWVVIFVLLVVQGVAFALLEPPWPAARVSLVTWGIVGAVILGEYLFHNYRYPHPAHRGLPDFIRHLARVDYRRLLDD